MQTIKLPNNTDQKSEQQLVELALVDISQFDQLYKLHVDKIYRYCYYKVYDQDKAADFTSEVFTKAIDAFVAKKYKYDSRVGMLGWLYRVAHNLIVDSYKKASNKNEIVIDEKIEFADDFDYVEIEKNLDLKAISSQIQSNLELFDDQTKSIIVLKFTEEYTFEQIAGSLEVNLSTVKMKYYRAIEFLKGKLKNYNV